MRSLVALILSASAVLATEVPSGQAVSLHEVLVDDTASGNWLRFRFLAPQISRDSDGLNYETAAADMIHLCDALALPYIDQYALTGEVIVISLSDRETEFGQPDPDATQFFEAFRVKDGTCIWEDF